MQNNKKLISAIFGSIKGSWIFAQLFTTKENLRGKKWCKFCKKENLSVKHGKNKKDSTGTMTYHEKEEKCSITYHEENFMTSNSPIVGQYEQRQPPPNKEISDKILVS